MSRLLTFQNGKYHAVDIKVGPICGGCIKESQLSVFFWGVHHYTTRQTFRMFKLKLVLFPNLLEHYLQDHFDRAVFCWERWSYVRIITHYDYSYRKLENFCCGQIFIDHFQRRKLNPMKYLSALINRVSLIS